MNILAAAILGLCIIFACQILSKRQAAPMINVVPPGPKPLKHGRYPTTMGQQAVVTAVGATALRGYVISAGFTAPLRTPCEWDTTGRAINASHAYDLREDA